jgi:xylitol oxidase
MRNWAGNITYSTADVREPQSMEELQEVVAGAERVKALGRGHSFNDVIDCAETLVSTRALPHTIRIDPRSGEVEVPGSTTYAELGPALHAQGWALPNMGSLPHISVAGAGATGTHGSGVDNRCLASSVVGIEMVRGDGTLLTARSGDPDFPGLVLALGSLGVVTRLWLELLPTYDVAQDVLLEVPTSVITEHGIELLSSAWSVSLFTSWRDAHTVDSVWRKSRVDAEADLDNVWGGRKAEVPVHPILGLDASAATEQLGRPGPWHERLPHFRAAFTPSVGDELQSEFFVPLDRLPELWPQLAAASPRFADALRVMEIRTIAADDLWLSPFHQRQSLAVHATWVSDLDAVLPALGELQAVLAPYDPRPHWAKVFRSWDVADTARSYPDLVRFQELAERIDPEACFVNDYLRRMGVRGSPALGA